MDKKVLDFVTEKTHELIKAPSCYEGLRKSAQEWLAAVGTDKEAEVTKTYIADIESCILPIDALIAFTGSEEGKKVFGDKAEVFHAHGLEIKTAGGKYCDCPACLACAAILEKKDQM